MLGAVWLAGRVPLKIVYLLVRRGLGQAILVFRTDLAKDAELLVLRHENAVLRRHASRVRYEPADQVWLAALARLISRNRWAEVFRVTPATLLAWHRRLAGRKHDTSERRNPGRPPTVPGVARLIVRLSKENPLWGAPPDPRRTERSAGSPSGLGPQRHHRLTYSSISTSHRACVTREGSG
jgi:putative transposase